MGDYGQCSWCNQDNDGTVEGHAVCWQHRDILHKRQALLKRLNKKREELDVLIDAVEAALKPPQRCLL